MPYISEMTTIRVQIIDEENAESILAQVAAIPGVISIEREDESNGGERVWEQAFAKTTDAQWSSLERFARGQADAGPLVERSEMITE